MYMHNYKNETYKREKGGKRRRNAKHIRRTERRWNLEGKGSEAEKNWVT